VNKLRAIFSWRSTYQDLKNPTKSRPSRWYQMPPHPALQAHTDPFRQQWMLTASFTRTQPGHNPASENKPTNQDLMQLWGEEFIDVASHGTAVPWISSCSPYNRKQFQVQRLLDHQFRIANTRTESINLDGKLSFTTSTNLLLLIVTQQTWWCTWDMNKMWDLSQTMAKHFSAY
jgi:hypothetical protein